MASSTDCTKGSDELPFHYHRSLIPYENERSSFSKPAVQQWARKVSCSSCIGFSWIGRSPSMTDPATPERALKLKDDES